MQMANGEIHGTTRERQIGGEGAAGQLQ